MLYSGINYTINTIVTILFCTTVCLFTECEDGKLRLVGGEYNNEGTVELCYNNLWGQISDVGWSNEDAKVVCNYLGYKNGGIAL